MSFTKDYGSPPIGGQKKRKKWPRDFWFSVVIGIFAVLLIISAFALESKKGTPDFSGMWQNIILGAMSSLVASVLIIFIQKAFVHDEHKELTKQLNTIEKALDNQSVLYKSGIRSIHPKIYFDKEGTFWTDILNNTEDKLDLVGHSIRTWFYPEFRDAFFKKVKTMLNEEKEVRIVLAPNSRPRLNCVFNTDRSRFEWRGTVESKAGQTIGALCQLLQDIDDMQKRKYLKVYVADPTKVTYMYIRTDEQSIISPYIFSPANSPQAFLLELESNSAYAKAFERDFEDMIGGLTCLDWGGFLN